MFGVFKEAYINLESYLILTNQLNFLILPSSFLSEMNKNIFTVLFIFL